MLTIRNLRERRGNGSIFLSVLFFCKQKTEIKDYTKLKTKMQVFQAGGLGGSQAAKVRGKNQVSESRTDQGKETARKDRLETSEGL